MARVAINDNEEKCYKIVIYLLENVKIYLKSNPLSMFVNKGSYLLEIMLCFSILAESERNGICVLV